MPIQQILAVATKKAGACLPMSVVFTSSPIHSGLLKYSPEGGCNAARPGLFCYAHVQKSKGGAKNGLLF